MEKGAGNAIAGVVTGVGFIGAALVFRQGPTAMLRGLTSAAAVFTTATIGVAAGAGYPWLAVVTFALVLLVLEVRFIPVLQFLDARRYIGRYAPDEDPPPPSRRRAPPPPTG